MSNRIHSLTYLKSTHWVAKIRKSEFAAKTQFLWSPPFRRRGSNSFSRILFCRVCVWREQFYNHRSTCFFHFFIFIFSFLCSSRWFFPSENEGVVILVFYKTRCVCNSLKELTLFFSAKLFLIFFIKKLFSLKEIKFHFFITHIDVFSSENTIKVIFDFSL